MLLANAEVGPSNLGATIDFGRSQYADERPSLAAALVQSRSRRLGLHLNDGYAKRDNGLKVGAAHEQATLKLLRAVHRRGFDGAIYFGTFSDASGLDPVVECSARIRSLHWMLQAVTRMEGDNRLALARGRQDPVLAQEIARLALARATAG